MRLAELVVAISLACFSLYLMWLAGEAPWGAERFSNIGFVLDEGLGSGAWPFWLSVVMFGCNIWVIINWIRKASPFSQSDARFLSGAQWITLAKVVVSLLVFIALIEIISFYFAILLFLFFSIKIFAKHRWTTSIAVSVAVPIFFFLFFDVAMRIDLPKGYAEPLFLPLYELFFS